MSLRIEHILSILLMLSLFELGCDEQAMNERGISIIGCVTDSLTNKPIPNAKVTLLCWYYAGWDKTDYVSIDTITDKNGCFSATLEKGYKAYVACVAPNYYPTLKSSDKVHSKPVEISLKLKRKANAETGLNLLPDINLRYYIVENSDN